MGDSRYDRLKTVHLEYFGVWDLASAFDKPQLNK